MPSMPYGGNGVREIVSQRRRAREHARAQW
jgi:hypothetical protein